jgi:hypothetical protein
MVAEGTCPALDLPPSDDSPYIQVQGAIQQLARTVRNMKERKKRRMNTMNTNTMELNMNEMEMVNGGSFLSILKGTALGIVIGATFGGSAAGPYGALVGGAAGGVVGGILGGAMAD